MACTMLIVDDSRVSRMMIRAFASELRPEMQFLEAGNGTEALALAATHAIQVVSMDLNMPGMDGLETARQLHLQHPELRIALLTANVQASTKEKAAAAGLFFVPKPITADTVSQILAATGA